MRNFGEIADVKMSFQQSCNCILNGKINKFDLFTFFIIVISRKAETKD